MSRDHRKLEAFQLADTLVLAVYQATRDLPQEERYGLQSQVRRAAVSVATNIVEGSARPWEPDYCRFLHLSHSSARETSYLLSLCQRLHYVDAAQAERLADDYQRVAAMLLRVAESFGPRP